MRGNTVMPGLPRRRRGDGARIRGRLVPLGRRAPCCTRTATSRSATACKDVIISGGENISTIEVEQVIVRHPSVLEAAVIGIPDDHWGERPKAFVTLVDGAERRRRRS